MTCVRATATLDCCLSLATTANMFGLAPTDDRAGGGDTGERLRVVHPLAQLTVASNFVANSIHSGGDSTKVKIFTEPTACGKSVYLKQMGLLCYLAHIGSFVPAVSAKIGLLAGIRMYTLDGVLDRMSTFAKDVGQLSDALRRSVGHLSRYHRRVRQGNNDGASDVHCRGRSRAGAGDGQEIDQQLRMMYDVEEEEEEIIRRNK